MIQINSVMSAISLGPETYNSGKKPYCDIYLFVIFENLSSFRLGN